MSDHDTWNMFAAHAPISLLDAMEAAGMGNDVRYALQRQEIDGNSPLFDAHAKICAKWADALLAESKKRETPEPAPPQSDAVSDQLAAALAGLLRRDEINTCQHENTHRGGVIWTICDDCGAKFADDTDPWKPFVEPREWADGYAALAAYRIVSEAGVTK